MTDGYAERPVWGFNGTIYQNFSHSPVIPVLKK